MTKLELNGMQIEVVDGVLQITGYSMPVKVNDFEVFSIESKEMKEEILNFFKSVTVKVDGYFSDRNNLNSYNSDILFEGNEFTAIIPANARFDFVELIFKNTVNPDNIYNYLDSLNNYTDNNDKIEAEENKFFEKFAKIIELFEVGTSRGRFVSNGFSLDSKEQVKDDLVFAFNASFNSKMTVEALINIIKEVIDYQKESNELLNSY